MRMKLFLAAGAIALGAFVAATAGAAGAGSPTRSSAS